MILPNIGAFIVWGFLIVLFGEFGWFPNVHIQKIIYPMMIYMIPFLLAYTGGKIIYNHLGGVIAVIASIGLIVTSTSPMILGVILITPFSAYLLRIIRESFLDKIREDYLILVDTLLIGLLGVLFSLLGLFIVGPVTNSIVEVLSILVDIIVNKNLLFIASVFIEPAKVLYLNNAINHGVLSPLGINEALEQGKSILFLLESNPGPGAGLLLAYWIFGNSTAKKTASASLLIQFIGGIHEVYFLYVLMNPKLILSLILGGMSGVVVFQIYNVGLAAPPVPGSIITIFSLIPKGNIVGVMTGILVSITVSFVVSAVILKMSKQR